MALVEIIPPDFDVETHLVYATAGNFTHAPVYGRAGCYLHGDAAAAQRHRSILLGLIATTVGPGAFTGLRVGLAAARGLALAGGLPMIGVTTLEALAHGAGEVRGERAVVAVLNARREEVYYQFFDGALAPLSPPRVGAAAAVELPAGAVLVVGDGADLIPAARGGNLVETMPSLLPDAAVVAAIAAARFDPAAAPGNPPEPLYLRSSGARQPATP